MIGYTFSFQNTSLFSFSYPAFIFLVSKLKNARYHHSRPKDFCCPHSLSVCNSLFLGSFAMWRKLLPCEKLHCQQFEHNLKVQSNSLLAKAQGGWLGLEKTCSTNAPTKKPPWRVFSGQAAISQVGEGQHHVFSFQQCSWVALFQFPVCLVVVWFWFCVGYFCFVFVFTLGFYVIWQECSSTWILWLLTSPIRTICSACNVTFHMWL